MYLVLTVLRLPVPFESDQRQPTEALMITKFHQVLLL